MGEHGWCPALPGHTLHPAHSSRHPLPCACAAERTFPCATLRGAQPRHANCRKEPQVEPPDSMSDTATVQILSDPKVKRADLHCHSRYSVFKYFRRANTSDCYNNPADVYRIAKDRRMSYVAITDHDSIDGAVYLLTKLT